jgi:hypothetical protein
MMSVKNNFKNLNFKYIWKCPKNVIQQIFLLKNYNLPNILFFKRWKKPILENFSTDYPGELEAVFEASLGYKPEAYRRE